MSYVWKGDDLHTGDERVPEEFREISISRDLGWSPDGNETFGMFVFVCDAKNNKSDRGFSIEFEKLRDFRKFEKMLAKAFMIRPAG